MLWGAVPVVGHPGIVQIPPVQREVHFLFPHLSPAQVARQLSRDTKALGRTQALIDMRRQAQLAGKEQTHWDVFVPSTVARRVGAAWLLVRNGPNLARRIAFLESLHVTKLAL